MLLVLIRLRGGGVVNVFPAWRRRAAYTCRAPEKRRAGVLLWALTLALLNTATKPAEEVHLSQGAQPYTRLGAPLQLPGDPGGRATSRVAAAASWGLSLTLSNETASYLRPCSPQTQPRLQGERGAWCNPPDPSGAAGGRPTRRRIDSTASPRSRLCGRKGNMAVLMDHTTSRPSAREMSDEP